MDCHFFIIHIALPSIVIILFVYCSSSIYPLAIAAHPQKPSQFAVGLTDGRVIVFEPQKPGEDWSKFSLDDNEVINTGLWE